MLVFASFYVVTGKNGFIPVLSDWNISLPERTTSTLIRFVKKS